MNYIEHCAMYSAFHRDWRNRATHYFGVPMISFSLFLPFGLIPLVGPINVATIFLIVSLVVYLRWDRDVALAMAAFYVPAYFVAMWIVAQGAATAWTTFAVLHIGGWIIQLVGHKFEGNRPALASNLFQSFVSPFFLTAEIFFALGKKLDLHEQIERIVLSGRFNQIAQGQPAE